MNSQANDNEKQIIPVSVKVSAPIEELIIEIGKSQDRGKSYVMRELMLRGLTLYREDGQLKPTAREERIIVMLIEEGIASGQKLKAASKSQKELKKK